MAGRPVRRARLEAEARAAGLPVPERRDFRAELTERLVAQLEAGTAPWQRTWSQSANGGRPYNPLSSDPGTVERGYRGVNRLMLMSAGSDFGDNRWCTRKQAEDLGYVLKDDQAKLGTPIEVWKPYTPRKKDERREGESKDEDETKVAGETRMGVRYYTLYNAAQFENFPKIELPERTWTPVERAEDLLRHSGAMIVHSPTENSPHYWSVTDRIVLPVPERFESASAYYDVATHELIHWTGHQSRLARGGIGSQFGSIEYAKEELIAEIGSMFMSADTGIPHNTGHHASYVASWIRLLREDKNIIARSSRDASTAVDLVLELDRERRLELERDRERGHERGHERDLAEIPRSTEERPRNSEMELSL